MSRRDDEIAAARAVINDTPQAALELLSAQPGVFTSLLSALQATRDVLCAPAVWPECRQEIIAVLTVALTMRADSVRRMREELKHTSADVRYEVALSAQRTENLKVIRQYLAALEVFRDDSIIATMRAADAGDETIAVKLAAERQQ